MGYVPDGPTVGSVNLLKGFFQMGFIALDLDAATQRLGERYGIREWRRKRSVDWMDPAHAWAGDVMIELIVLEDGAPPLYDGFEPATPSDVRLHHHGYLVEDAAQWAGLQQMVEQAGLDVPMGGALMDGHLNYMYVDTRPDLGIYTEFIYETGPARNRYDDVPRN